MLSSQVLLGAALIYGPHNIIIPLESRMFYACSEPDPFNGSHDMSSMFWWRFRCVKEQEFCAKWRDGQTEMIDQGADSPPSGPLYSGSPSRTHTPDIVSYNWHFCLKRRPIAQFHYAAVNTVEYAIEVIESTHFLSVSGTRTSRIKRPAHSTVSYIRASHENIFRKSYKSSYTVQLTLVSSWNYRMVRKLSEVNSWDIKISGKGKRGDLYTVRRQWPIPLLWIFSVKVLALFVSTVDKGNSIVMEDPDPQQKRS